ncbi:MAG: sialate O-acetylesterase [Phycisphaerales bacterium]|nr:sialate O-acetylesterase [Phycisphaerales bacterium]
MTTCLSVLFLLLSMVAGADDVSAEQKPPVRVFLLAGQSNMVGAGQVKANPDRHDGMGSLEWLVDASPDKARYAHLRNVNGTWVQRDDVKIWSLGRTGDLAPGFGANETRIGPELGFGSVVGEAYDEPVLLIKIAWGGKSIAQDFRPPSSGGEVGPNYRILVDTTKEVLRDAGEHFPELDGRAVQLMGIGWHQGWNDRVNQAFNDAYEENLSNFIRDVRHELGLPRLPFVIAETGMSGHDEKHPRALSLMAAQAAVAEREEFEGNVGFVPTRGFYRSPERSPSGQQYHWNGNAETYYLIGEGMGRAMIDLCRTKEYPGAMPGPSR